VSTKEHRDSQENVFTCTMELNTVTSLAFIYAKKENQTTSRKIPRTKIIGIKTKIAITDPLLDTTTKTILSRKLTIISTEKILINPTVRTKEISINQMDLEDSIITTTPLRYLITLEMKWIASKTK
jgi:hypothetical protein